MEVIRFLSAPEKYTIVERQIFLVTPSQKAELDAQIEWYQTMVSMSANAHPHEPHHQNIRTNNIPPNINIPLPVTPKRNDGKGRAWPTSPFPTLDSPPHFSYHPQPPSPGTAWQRPPRTPTSSPSPQRAQRAQRFSNPPLSPLVTAMPNLSRNSSMSPIFRTPGLIQRIRPRPSYSISRPKMPVKMSPELVNKFIEVSTDNSFIGVETGAILGGFISANKSFYVVDHLFIPDQIGYSTSYSDTDSTTCGLLMLQSNRQNLGTIHTHPGHLKSFMSSVDLHMHSLIQKDCNSAIALVHSPRYSTTPSYSLTDFGLGKIN